MNEEKLAAILARGDVAALNGAADMWRNAIADMTLALIEAGEDVTRETLRQGIGMQITACENKFDRARLVGALNVLNGRPPRD